MGYIMHNTLEYKKGLPYEIKAQNIIKLALDVDVIDICNNGDYDFKDSDGKTYEVKNDTLSFKYKTFFITYKQKMNNNTFYQPAGISTSKSDYYMLRFGESFYKIKTSNIRMLIFQNEYKHACSKNDRGDLIVGIRLPVDDVKPYATIYNFDDYED